MNYIKKELKKLVPVSLLILIVSFPSWRWGLVVLGLFLLVEHRLTYVRWDIKDLIGHETFGIILLMIGLLLLEMHVQAILSLIVYLGFGNYNWDEDMSPWEYAKKKVGLWN